MANTISQIQNYRINIVYSFLIVVCCALIWRVLDLQFINNEFLQGQGNARVLRELEITAHRGMITDRNGYPLAISTPVSSIWINPQEFDAENKNIFQFAKLLNLNSQYVKNRVKQKEKKEFVYIKRRINPELAQQIIDMDIKGVHVQREYRRYYPEGEIFGHVLGFTDVDDNGQEGMELAYNDWLSGQSGSKRVVKDRLGQIIAIEEQIASSQPGKTLVLSLERRVQYLAYKALKNAVKEHKAKSGSIVVMDIETGAVIAMANQPAFNPNKLQDRKSGLYRNRAITDLFEPGSTMKPLAIASALSLGIYSPQTQIDTGDGWFMVDGKTIKDTSAHGMIDVSTILQKSSNVGTAKIALELPRNLLWDTYESFGLGHDTGSGFPGESAGRLVRPRRVSNIEQATMSFGYGVSVTSLQLANAYSIIARQGQKKAVSFLLNSEQNNSGQQNSVQQYNTDTVENIEPAVSLSPRSLAQVAGMMEQVVQDGGTAPQASVAAYRVAGKTGTVKKNSKFGGYTKKKYSAVFAGYAPASQPKLAIVVMIDEPNNGAYYSGIVAAPVFSKVMSGALSLLNIDPDNISQLDIASQIEEHLRRQG